ncbi:MAG: thioredoxin domain-containing protein [Verrucomicrobiota bacterium JB022]|nr:thioredoxin domain-containing protein [Verrucomicrobiota bacterium JB022]
MKKISPLLALLCWFATALNAAPALYAVKIHADWCVVCKRLEPAFEAAQSELKEADVAFLKFDLTSDATQAASQEKARELGLEALFAQRLPTGIVVVYDPETQEIRQILKVNRSGAQMAEAIRELLAQES